ncbi:MAG: class I SAM-dependent methyltransferase [Pseudomonadota bacterium]
MMSQAEAGPTALDRLRTLIRQDGPISVAEYMAFCLGDRTHGYYPSRNPLGASGDFITAPEVSQMFGELVGTWLRTVWSSHAARGPLRLVELGPGRSTLMQDILRVLAHDADRFAELGIHLVETSPVLRQQQKTALADAVGRGLTVRWHDTFEDVPDGPLYVIGNEFFDALPVRQFVFGASGWAERVIGLDGESLAFGLRPAGLDRTAVPPELPAPSPGDILEISPVREALALEIGRRIATDGGAGLFFDYGPAVWGYGDTLQAVRKHAYADVLAEPGEADLTTHVDFSALARAFGKAGAICPPVLTQGDFLLAMGLLERAGKLGFGTDAATQDMIRDAVERLAGPAQMGHVFKAICVTDREPGPYPFGGKTFRKSDGQPSG